MSRSILGFYNDYAYQYKKVCIQAYRMISGRHRLAAVTTLVVLLAFYGLGCGDDKVSSEGSRTLKFGAASKDLGSTALFLRADPTGKPRFIPRMIMAPVGISVIRFENATQIPHNVVLRDASRKIVVKSQVIKLTVIDISTGELKPGRYTYSSGVPGQERMDGVLVVGRSNNSGGQ